MAAWQKQDLLDPLSADDTRIFLLIHLLVNFGLLGRGLDLLVLGQDCYLLLQLSVVLQKALFLPLGPCDLVLQDLLLDVRHLAFLLFRVDLFLEEVNFGLHLLD